MKKLEAAKIGAAGELLVQRELLRCGIDSARLTTDYGIDLVAIEGKKAFTIQVKTRTPQRKGTMFGWRVKDDKVGAADLFALVAEDKSWYLSQSELRNSGSRKANGLQVVFFEGRGKGKHAAQTFECFKGEPGTRRFFKI